MNRSHCLRAARLAFGFLPFSACSSAPESAQGAPTTMGGPDTYVAAAHSLLFCEGPEVANTGINHRFLQGVGYRDGYFYAASDYDINRVAVTGVQPETVITSPTKATAVYFSDAHVVRITTEGRAEVLDYAGAELGVVELLESTPRLSPDNNTLYALTPGAALEYRQIDLTTFAESEHVVDLGESGWAQDYAAHVGDFDWEIQYGADSLFVTAGFDLGHLYKIDLSTQRLERFAADLPGAYLVGSAGTSVYLSTAYDDAVEVPDTFQVDVPSGKRTPIETLHGNGSLSVSFWPGFDQRFYFRDTGPFYVVDGAQATYIGSVPTECLRNGVGSVNGEYFAFMHPSGSDTEVVVRKLHSEK